MVTTLTRRALVGGALLTAIALPLTAVSSPASAASFTSVTVQGEGLTAPLSVRADADPELFSAVISQVTWMATRSGQTTRPKADRLGPKYTVLVYLKEAAKQRYELYPLAKGGPRAYRPAKQPGSKAATPAWFFGRLNMSETLRLAGVPLPARADALSSGVGGGIAGGAEDSVDDAAFAPMEEVSAAFSEWRRLIALNGAIALLIAAGLAGFALLIRPKT